MYRALASLLVCLALVSYGRSDEPPAGRTALDLIPADATAAIAIRNVAELTKRGDDFIGKTGIKSDFRLTEGYNLVVGFLGIKGGLDREGAACLMLLETEVEKLSVESLVLAAPVADAEAVAKNFHLEPKDLAEGVVIDRKEREANPMEFARFVAMRGKHIFLGSSEKWVAAAVKSKRLRPALAAEEAASFDASDILVYANPRKLDRWDGLWPGIEAEAKNLPEEEAQVLRQLADASQELQYALAGVRLDEGLGGNLLLRFEGDKSRELLSSLSAGEQKASLAGLPRGRVLAVHAAGGSGEGTAALARVLLKATLLNWPASAQSLISEAQRPHLVNVFGEVWQRLEGSRSALYENEHSERDGQFSTIAVLETKDPARFLADMASLATFVNASELLSRGEEKIDAKTIGDLIVQLGDDSYSVRQTATTKLGLLGPAALPELEKAAKSSDPETKFRAIAIRDEIVAGEAQQREDLVKNDLLSRIKPQFAYFPKKETRDGRAIEVVQMLLVDDDAQYSGPLRRLLGPEWDKIRLATVGKRVVVLLGSNTALLDQAIAGLEMPDKDLNSEPLLATFRDRAGKDHTAELHLSLGQTQRLLAPAAPADDKPSEPAMTSVGVRIKPDRVRLEFFAPYSEAKAVVGHLGW